jgi:HlyD family secretion protein
MTATAPIDAHSSSVHVGSLDDPAREMRWATILGAIFIVVFIGGLGLMPLDSAALGGGAVTVSGNRQAVQHRGGGIVSALFVTEGQRVRKGDVLLTLSATEIGAQERALTVEAYALMAQRERLIAERDGKNGVEVPPEFASVGANDRPLALAALETQRRVFETRRLATKAQIGILSQRNRQADTQVVGYRRQIDANREQRRLISDELAALRTLMEKGYASKSRVRSVERAAAQLDGEYGALNAQIARMGEASGEIAMQSVGVTRDVAKEVTQDLRDVTLRLDELNPKLIALREELQRAQIRAPAGGKVLNLRTFTVGGVVASGEVIMEIVPTDRDLVITAMLAPTYADDIQIGQSAQIRFPGLHSRSLPLIDGRITNVSADSRIDERTGQSFFEIEVQVPLTTLEQQVRTLQSTNIIAGMPAEVMVPLRKRTALQFVLEPIIQSFWRAGRED